MKYINTVIKSDFRKRFLAYMKSEVEEQLGIMMAGFVLLGEVQVTCGRVVCLKFPVHLLLHPYNVFRNRRLYPPSPNF